MEMLILSGLAYLGYELSKDGKVPRRSLNDTKLKERCNKYPISNDTVPEIPVPNHNNMVPYFTSAKAQNTNDSYKQRNLETFTGTDASLFQSKREQEALFQPESNLTNIHGTQLSLDDNNRKDRYANNITSIMNNVAPVEKQYVGPGLNTGTDIASKGGFHDMYRILPNNVNSYKKNTFAGKIISGKGVTTQRDATPTLNDNKKPERYYTLNQVPVSQQSGPVSAPIVRGETIIQNTQRESCTPAIGIAGPARVNEALTATSQNATRDFDRTNCAIYGNPGMPGNGAGAYTTSTMIMAPGQREQCNDNEINVQNQNTGSNVYYSDGAMPTQRGTHNAYNGHLHNGSVVGSQNTNGYVVNSTMREQSSTQYNGNPNQAGNASSSRQYSVNPTLRGNNANNYNAPAGSIHKASIRYDTAQNACMYKQREEMGRDYTPGSGNMNLRADAQDILPHMIVKNDCNSEKYVAPIKGPNAIPFEQTKGQTEYVAKIPVHNTRLDLTIAENQMASSEVAHNINARQ